jgi:hypothetical protein
MICTDLPCIEEGTEGDGSTTTEEPTISDTTISHSVVYTEDTDPIADGQMHSSPEFEVETSTAAKVQLRPEADVVADIYFTSLTETDTETAAGGISVADHPVNKSSSSKNTAVKSSRRRIIRTRSDTESLKATLILMLNN